MQRARRNYMTEAFLGRGECFEACSAHKRGPWLSCMVDSSSSCPTFKLSSQLLPCPFHPTCCQLGPLMTHAQTPQLPLSSPLHLPPSLRTREVPCPVQLWSPGTTRSLWPTETSRTGRPGKESAFKGLKIRWGFER